jgi:hypothetical protein
MNGILTGGPWCETTRPAGMHPATWLIDATAGQQRISTAACDQHLTAVRTAAARIAQPVHIRPAPGNPRASPKPDQHDQPALF